MESAKDLKKVYDIFLSVPGMNDPVKINLQISRKNVLVLTQLITKGLSKEEGKIKELLEVVSKETLDEIGNIANDLLEKSGLVLLNEKLSNF